MILLSPESAPPFVGGAPPIVGVDPRQPGEKPPFYACLRRRHERRTRHPRYLGRRLRQYDVEIHPVICTTNAIESIDARYRRAGRAKGHFPNEAAALRSLYLVIRSLDPTGGGRACWVIRWKPAFIAFAITFA